MPAVLCLLLVTLRKTEATTVLSKAASNGQKGRAVADKVGHGQQQPVMLHLGLPLDPLQRHDSLAVLTLSNTPKAQRM
jgi:hypothetical protein